MNEQDWWFPQKDEFVVGWNDGQSSEALHIAQYRNRTTGGFILSDGNKFDHVASLSDQEGFPVEVRQTLSEFVEVTAWV